MTKPSLTRVVIHGAKGRMGQTLLARADRLEGVRAVAAVDQGDDLRLALGGADVVIDFSLHDATPAAAAVCAEAGKALVIGTTGLNETESSDVLRHRHRIPMVWSSNYSTGVNTLFWLTRKAAEILGPDFDLEVVEMHHRMKKDAPSGTATTLGEILSEVRGRHLSEVARHGRSGLVGERSREEIGMHALRGGDVVGDHTVMFASEGERLELTHRASSRETFANGALRAARWVHGREPGLYSMQDVLGLK